MDKLQKEINAAIKESGITNEELAKRSGVNASTIWRYINGKRSIGSTNISKLMRAIANMTGKSQRLNIEFKPKGRPRKQ